MKPLLQKIVDAYGLELNLVEKVSQGFLSENYILTDGTDKFFLKKYRFDNSGRIEEIHRTKKYFSDGGIPVILPIPTASKDTFFENERHLYALFPFVHDHQLQWKEVTDNALISYAQMLARIHLLGSKSAVAVNEFNKPWNSEVTLKLIGSILQKISGIENKTDFDIRAEKNLLLKKEIIESNQKAYSEFHLSNDHLIHGDYTVANVFFDKDNNVSFVFDWEKTEYSPRFLELFRSLIQCTLFDTIRSKTYLDAYLKLYPATKDELKSGLDAYCLEQTHSLWIEEEHYLKGNNRTDELLESNSFKINYFAHELEDFKKHVF